MTAFYPALRYTDEKSDKFWRVEILGCALVTNWGKAGTNGKYALKEFDSEEECRKEAEKLFRSKLKKGYAEWNEFDPLAHFYFDDEEFGLHPLTAHPRFRQYFTDELYYDCADEEAPFGSDEGADALAMLAEMLRKKPTVNFADLPRWLMDDEWELGYLPPDAPYDEEDVETSYYSDQVTLAFAFGQIKITGSIDPDLASQALGSLERMKKTHILMGLDQYNSPRFIPLMESDLRRFGIATKKGDHL
ncbi:MAG: WGR domain-containing protein [Clostridia bacterium]|nr:WGR domain-containing protein [Clostridia bacterium]